MININTDSEIYIWIRDILITLIGVFSALFFGWLINKKYQSSKIRKFYKSLKEEIRENIEMAKQLINLCDEYLNEVKGKNYTDPRGVFTVLLTHFQKTRKEVYKIITKQDLTFLLKEEDVKKLSTDL